ncbi:MAG TPA: haloacid dehalogenase type II [Chthonomonadaceae bacterium]|nr:haloacid dehalogenase type II [Chthonomonadaceae bacterium]
MTSNRREFLGLAVGSVATGLLEAPSLALAAAKPEIKAVAFDAFPIFDPRPVFALAENLFPGRGAEISSAWRTRQFEYTWLRALSRRYADFWQVTEDALNFAAKTLKLELSAEKRQRLMAAYLELGTWPDVLPALKALKEGGIRLAFLSNFTPKMLGAAIQRSGLNDLFEFVLSTDAVQTYKPDPRAYQMGVDAFHLKREEILFAAFAGWDAAGAKSFGYPTFWVNRTKAPAEELGVSPDGMGETLTDLVNFIKSQR